jgi:hypothetical protein
MEDYDVSDDVHELIRPIQEPLPDFNNKAVYEMYQAIRDELKEYREMSRKRDEKLDKIVEKLEDNCSKKREQCIVENGEKFRDIFDRLKSVEFTCTSFESVRSLIPSTADLAVAKSDMLKDAREEDKSISSRLDNLEGEIKALNKKLAFLDIAWWSGCHVKDGFKTLVQSKNRFVQAIFLLVALGYLQLNLDTILIIAGRAHDFLHWP